MQKIQVQSAKILFVHQKTLYQLFFIQIVNSQHENTNWFCTQKPV